MGRDQYVVTAFYKNAPKVEYIALVTGVAEEAYGYDVSSYLDSGWNVYVEHFVVDEKCVVVRHAGAKLIYPKIGTAS